MAATGGPRRRDLQHINLVYGFGRALDNHLPVLVVVTRQRCDAADGADLGVVVLEELRRFGWREEGSYFFREGGHLAAAFGFQMWESVALRGLCVSERGAFASHGGLGMLAVQPSTNAAGGAGTSELAASFAKNAKKS